MKTPFVTRDQLEAIAAQYADLPCPIPPEEVPQAVDAANACPVSAIRTEA